MSHRLLQSLGPNFGKITGARIVKTFSTYHLQGKIRNFGSKIKWLAYSVLKASKNMGCNLRRCNFLRFSVCSADLDISCSGSSSHLVKFCSLTFMHKISTRVVCLNGKHLRFYPLVQLRGFCGFEVSWDDVPTLKTELYRKRSIKTLGCVLIYFKFGEGPLLYPESLMGRRLKRFASW